MLAKLAENKIKTLDNFADLSTDELVDKEDGIFREFNMDEKTANQLIMKAREHWFTEKTVPDEEVNKTENV